MAIPSIVSIDTIDKSGAAARPTLDQLLVLSTVVETGSFSAAARRLGRAQSVVSYSIANLESQLGLTLFDRAQRRPALTEAGRAVLADARRVGRAVEDLRARAAGLSGGLEAEVTLAVDVMVPIERLVGALHEFAASFPTVALRLHVEALGAVVQLVLARTCTLGISGWMALLHDGLERHPLDGIVMVPVVSPRHRLASLDGPIAVAALRDETQLVLSDRSRLTEGQDFGVLSARCWRLGDLGAKHALLRAGLGWGNMPEAMVARDLREGRLVRLRIDGHAPLRLLPMLIHRSDAPLGPAATWLARRLREAAGEPAGEPAGADRVADDAEQP